MKAIDGKFVEEDLSAGEEVYGMDFPLDSEQLLVNIENDIRMSEAAIDHVTGTPHNEFPDDYDSISAAQKIIAEWADTVMPDRKPRNALVKMMVEELPELIGSDLEDPSEFADVAILLFDIAHLKGIDIGKAIRQKMKINRERTWHIDEEIGVLKHD